MEFTKEELQVIEDACETELALVGFVERRMGARFPEGKLRIATIAAKIDQIRKEQQAAEEKAKAEAEAKASRRRRSPEAKPQEQEKG